MSSRAGLLLLLLLATAAGLSWNSLENPYIRDDENTLVNNPEVRRFWPPWRHFLEPRTFTVAHRGGYTVYRPLTPLTFSAGVHLHGLRPAGHRLTNLLLHALVAFLTFLLARLLASERTAALAAALLVVHPLGTWTAQYVSARDLLLTTLFGLASLHAWVAAPPGPEGRRGRILSGVLLGLAVCAKRNMLVLPLIMGLHELLLRRGEESWRDRLLPVLPMLALSAAAFLAPVLLLGVHGDANVPTGPLDCLRHLAGQLEVQVLHYLGWIFRPDQIRWAAAAPPATPLGVGSWIGGMVLLGLSLAAWRVRSSRPRVCFGWFAYLIALAPSSSLLPVLPPSVPYRPYPGLPYLALAAASLALGGESPPSRRRRVALGLVLVLLGIASRKVGWLHMTRNRLWGHSRQLGATERAEIFWAAAVDDLEETARRLGQVAARYPDRILIHVALGRTLLALGRDREAVASLSRAVEVDTTPSVAYWLALGRQIAGTGTDAERVEARDRARAGRDAPRPGYLIWLGYQLMIRGRARAAQLPLQDATEIDPGLAESWFRLGEACRASGDAHAAQAAFRRAAELGDKRVRRMSAEPGKSPQP